MGWFTKKKATDEAQSGSGQALAVQDPRTKVHTTTAATETTNTAVQNSTIIDNNKKTVTYMSTRQTVTHTQQARVTEITTRRTPSQAELEELMAELRMNGGTATTTTTSTSTSNKRTSPSSLYGVSLRSTPSFKAGSEHRRSNTLVKMEQTSASQKQGRTVTQHVETKRLVLNPKRTWPPAAAASSSSSSTASTSKAASSSALVKPYKPPLTITEFDNTYVSPYASKLGAKSTITSSYTPKTTITPSSKFTLSTPKTTLSSSSSSVLKPTLSTPKTTVTSSLKPTLSTPRTTITSTWKPTVATTKTTTTPSTFISLGSNNSNPSASRRSSDAVGKTKFTSGIPPPETGYDKKLKPADVYIFNHEKFDNDNEFREGSSEDEKLLLKTFKGFKCNVKVIRNATVDEVRTNVQKLEKKNFADHSALVVVVLTHGQRNDTLCAKDGVYKLDDDVVFPIVRNRTLQNKPKIFFVQACKGSRELGGFKTDSVQPHGSPSEILKCYSTYEGYVSYRHDDGTPFIKTLCDTLEKKPNDDIETIMHNVRRCVQAYTQNGQIPAVTTTLTSKYSFGDYR